MHVWASCTVMKKILWNRPPQMTIEPSASAMVCQLPLFFTLNFLLWRKISKMFWRPTCIWLSPNSRRGSTIAVTGAGQNTYFANHKISCITTQTFVYCKHEKDPRPVWRQSRLVCGRYHLKTEVFENTQKKISLMENKRAYYPNSFAADISEYCFTNKSKAFPL